MRFAAIGEGDTVAGSWCSLARTGCWNAEHVVRYVLVLAACDRPSRKFVVRRKPTKSQLRPTQLERCEIVCLLSSPR